jgi:glycosyltransferase involved in cell wall biosynthesis
VEQAGVTYHFHPSDSALASAVAAAAPAVVHVHGLGWSRLIRRLHRAAPHTPIVVQHHGEPPFTGRAKWGHRAVRRHIAAYLFTGVEHGQVQPWIDGGVIRRDARCCEVLEAASLLPLGAVAAHPAELEGSPVVLWVGRLIEGKDPLTAVDAFAAAAASLPGGHLHMLAADRSMEPAVRARIAQLGPVGQRVHLHQPVPHDEMAGWYAAAGVFLATSRREGSGYSLIEAVTCGCVPVVSAIPPHLAIVGRSGHVFDVGDAASAAAGLIAAADEPREPIVAASRTLLSWGKVAGQLVSAYSLATGGREPLVGRKRNR